MQCVVAVDKPARGWWHEQGDEHIILNAYEALMMVHPKKQTLGGRQVSRRNTKSADLHDQSPNFYQRKAKQRPRPKSPEARPGPSR